MKLHNIIIIILVGILISGCNNQSDINSPIDKPDSTKETDGYSNLSVSELKSLLEDKKFIFVNVHIPFEGNIPDTDLSIPFNEMEEYIDKLPSDKDEKIILYCRSGSMSSIASKTLIDLGYRNVWNLEGGFNAWESAGLPIVGLD